MPNKIITEFGIERKKPSNDLNETNLFDSIKKAVTDIEFDLLQVNGTGVFFAPELYIAFRIGREIFLERDFIFSADKSSIYWKRETSLEGAGPTDILFEHGNEKTIIELKVGDSVNSYYKDIDKLRNANKKYAKFFCVLLDTIVGKDDGREKAIEKYLRGNERDCFTLIFRTNSNRYNYSSPIMAVLKIYKIFE
jgi:hypothetical protein